MFKNGGKTHQEEKLLIAVYGHCEADRGCAHLTRTEVEVQEGGGIKHTVHLRAHRHTQTHTVSMVNTYIQQNVK